MNPSLNYVPWRAILDRAIDKPGVEAEAWEDNKWISPRDGDPKST